MMMIYFEGHKDYFKIKLLIRKRFEIHKINICLIFNKTPKNTNHLNYLTVHPIMFS